VSAIEDIFDGGHRRVEPSWQSQMDALWDRQQADERGMRSPCYCDASVEPHEHGPGCHRPYPVSYNLRNASANKVAVGWRDLAVPAAGLALMAPGAQPSAPTREMAPTPQAVQRAQIPVPTNSSCVVRSDSPQIQGIQATRVPQLESKLPQMGNETGRAPFEVYATANTNASFVQIPINRIFLAKPVCEMLLYGSPKSELNNEFPWAFSIHTLYHEWWHLAFSEYDEKNTDLGALSVMREMMVKYWGLTPQEAQKNYELVAGKVGVEGPARSSYGPTYTPNARDPLLGDAPAAQGSPAPAPGRRQAR